MATGQPRAILINKINGPSQSSPRCAAVCRWKPGHARLGAGGPESGRLTGRSHADDGWPFGPIVLAAVRSLVNFSRMKASFGISGAVNVGTPFLRH
jgi:hypothetical protein